MAVRVEHWVIQVEEKNGKVMSENFLLGKFANRYIYNKYISTTCLSKKIMKGCRIRASCQQDKTIILVLDMRIFKSKIFLIFKK